MSMATHLASEVSPPSKLPSEDVEEVKSKSGKEESSPSYLSNYLLLFFIGTINNMTFQIVMSASRSLSEELGSPQDFGLIGWANISLSLVQNILVAVLAELGVPYYLRIGLNASFLVGGLLAVGLAESFWMALLGIMFTGVSSAFGDVLYVSYLRYFDPRLTGAFISGTGMAGLGGSLLYLLFHNVVGVENQTFFLGLLVLPVVYYPLFFLLKPLHPIQAKPSSTKRTFMESVVHYLRIWRKISYFAFNLSLVFFLEFQTFGKWNRDSNPVPVSSRSELSPSTLWLKCNSYEILAFCYQAGVLVSRSSLPVLRRVPWLQVHHVSYVQAGLWGFWLAQSRLHFLPVPLQFPLMTLVGLCGGCSYVLTMFSINSGKSKAKTEEEKEGAVIMVGLTVTLFLITNFLLTYLLDNTVWPPVDRSGCEL